MKQYRNIVTGTVITTPCDCSGKNWEQIKGRGKPKAAPIEKTPEEAKEAAAVAAPPEEVTGGAEIGPAAEPEAAEEGTEENR